MLPLLLGGRGRAPRAYTTRPPFCPDFCPPPLFPDLLPARDSAVRPPFAASSHLTDAPAPYLSYPQPDDCRRPPTSPAPNKPPTTSGKPQPNGHPAPPASDSVRRGWKRARPVTMGGPVPRRAPEPPIGPEEPCRFISSHGRARALPILPPTRRLPPTAYLPCSK